jgi:hypothetical protein
MSVSKDDLSVWRNQLESALLKEGRTVVLADVDDKTSVIHVRPAKPEHLLEIARSLAEDALESLEQASLERSDGEDACTAIESMLRILDDVLSLLPTPHREMNG